VTQCPAVARSRRHLSSLQSLTQPPKHFSHATPYAYKCDVAATEFSSNDTARALQQSWLKERAQEEAPRTWAARRPRVRRARPTPPTRRSRPRSRRRKPQRQPSGPRAQSPTPRRTSTHVFLERSYILTFHQRGRRRKGRRSRTQEARESPPPRARRSLPPLQTQGRRRKESREEALRARRRHRLGPRRL
jgi:hypothetical protein